MCLLELESNLHNIAFYVDVSDTFHQFPLAEMQPILIIIAVINIKPKNEIKCFSQGQGLSDSSTGQCNRWIERAQQNGTSEA